jgi:citrate lyase beta subunit
MVRRDRPVEPVEPVAPVDPFRVRRSCLAVPASSERFIAKAHGLPADEVFLDLEDAVAPAAKAQARANAVAAVTGDWGGRVLAVRVNDASTPWAHRDVIDVVSAAGRLDGPYLKVRDVDGFRRSAASAAALGYDGKWVLHPDQIDAANEVFAPSPDDFARASGIVEAYAHATGVQARGAVMFGDEMIDEASHKMARASWPGAARPALAPAPAATRASSRKIRKQDRESLIFAPGA